ncbi:hypothetical protein HDR61_00055 [bacterium]|nr:hypothetical protein [bacterium]
MSDIVYKNFAISTPFLRGFKELKIPVMDAGGNPAWPEVFPVPRIEQMRDTVGRRHFMSQMMLECGGLERVRLDPGALHFYDAEFDAAHARIGDKRVTGAALYWDPSGGRRKSDGSVCVLAFRDDTSHRAFIHDALYLRVDDNDAHPLAHQCDMVLDFMTARAMRRIAIETNGIGNALPEIMRDVASRRGANIFVQKIVNNKNKESRILDAIEPLLSTGRLYAHARLKQTPLMSEMLGWSPIGATTHDDGLDAVAGALALTPYVIRPRGAASQIFSANTNFKI